MKDIDRAGIAAVAEQAIALAAAARPASTSRSISTSAIPAIAPGVGTPVKGGLDYREAHMVMEMVADSDAAARARPRRGEPDARRPQQHGGTRRPSWSLSALGMKIL